MKSLYLASTRPSWLVLLLFAFASGWVVERHIDQERQRNESVVNERLGAWADLIQRSLPGADAPAETQAAALRDWSTAPAHAARARRRDGAAHRRLRSFARREAEGVSRPFPFKLDDGRTLWTMRPGSCGSWPGERRGRRRPPTRPAASRRRGRRCRRACRAAPAWRSSWWCCSSPSPPAPIRSCAG